MRYCHRDAEHTMRFIDTKHCAGRAHCSTCRAGKAGRYLRQAWGRHYQLPGDKIDFDCPAGFTADNLPKPAITNLREQSTIAAKRLAVCEDCGDDACGIKHQSGCRRRAVLGREDFHCPQRRF